MFLLDLIQLVYWYDRQTTPLPDKGYLWNDPSGLLIFCVVVSRCSGNNYGTRPNLWVQKKFIKLRQSTQNAWLRPAKFVGKNFSKPPFNFFRNLSVLLFSHPRTQCFVTGCSISFLIFLETASNFLPFLNAAINLREKLVSCENLIDFYFFNKSLISSFMREKVSIVADS